MFYDCTKSAYIAEEPNGPKGPNLDVDDDFTKSFHHLILVTVIKILFILNLI
jgi:hypothetical protein